MKNPRNTLMTIFSFTTILIAIVLFSFSKNKKENKNAMQEKQNFNNQVQVQVIDDQIEINNQIEKTEEKEKFKTIIINFEQFNNFAQEEQNIAYAIGYINGQNAMHNQAKDSVRVVLKNEEKYKIEINGELQKIVDEGYVDGYHKVSESFYCPTNRHY